MGCKKGFCTYNARALLGCPTARHHSDEKTAATPIKIKVISIRFSSAPSHATRCTHTQRRTHKGIQVPRLARRFISCTVAASGGSKRRIASCELTALRWEFKQRLLPQDTSHLSEAFKGSPLNKLRYAAVDVNARRRHFDSLHATGLA